MIPTMPKQINALNSWLARKIGCPDPTRQELERYQLRKLQETIRLACRFSPFYRRTLTGFDTEINCLEDLQRFPLISAENIRQQALKMLCVPQSEISRVVSLDSSGTTGKAKRLYFTPDDQNLTIDFFEQGTAAFIGENDRVLILLPGERPGSVGDLLRIALLRHRAKPLVYGVCWDIPEMLRLIKREKITSLVGIPVQVLSLARYAENISGTAVHLDSVLLSTDYAPQPLVREIKRLWRCKVFEHYGMTEMGLGGGTECGFHTGYHLHEADFLFEIVDPLTGSPLPAGQSGEIVVTTLTRQGMPLIRYRTGDIARRLDGPCACGAVVGRLAKIERRKSVEICLRGKRLAMSDLSEVLFTVRDLIDFSAAVDDRRQVKQLQITARFWRNTGLEQDALRQALDLLPAIRSARQAGQLDVIVKVRCSDNAEAPNPAKRAITELSEVAEKL